MNNNTPTHQPNQKRTSRGRPHPRYVIPEDGSEPLRHPPWERFAHDAVHMDQAEAYRRSYPGSRKWNLQHVAVKASMLTTKIARRIDYLRRQNARNLDATRSRVLQRYAHIAFTDLPGIVRWRGTNGRSKEPVYGLEIEDFEKLTPAQRAAIKRLKVSPPDNEGHQATEIELHDPLKALDALSKHLGLFKDEVAQAGTMNVQINFGDGRGIDLCSDRPPPLEKPPERTLIADATRTVTDSK